jgi:hypothetical protein
MSDRIPSQETFSILPFADIHLAGLIFIDLVVNGKAYPFMFDTGASITVVNEEIAKKVELRILDKSARGIGNAGNWIDTKIGVVETLQMGAITVSDLEVSVLPSKYLTFVIDDKNTELKINGFLGWDVIQHFKWTIDNSNKTIKVERPASQECTQNLTHDVMPTISVQFKEEQLYFGFDCGNTESVLGIKMFERIHPQNQKSDSFTGVDGTIEQTVFEVEDFECQVINSTIHLQHVPMIQQDVYKAKTIESMGLLASDIVVNRSWMIDYPNHHFEILD